MMGGSLRACTGKGDNGLTRDKISAQYGFLTISARRRRARAPRFQGIGKAGKHGHGARQWWWT